MLNLDYGNIYIYIYFEGIIISIVNVHFVKYLNNLCFYNYPVSKTKSDNNNNIYESF